MHDFIFKNKDFAKSAIGSTLLAVILFLLAKTHHDLAFLFVINNMIAALLGLLGTIMVYMYGIPRKTEHDDENYLCVNPPGSSEESEKARLEIEKFKCRANFGLGMIAASFLITGFFTS